MSATVEQREQVVTTAIREISHIATLPEITMKIIDLVEDPQSTAQDLHKVISGDPALCSRILKVVNSSFYGLPGQIGSINRAIVMLGLNAVKNIAIAASLAKLFRGGELTTNFGARDLWKHSNVTAAAAKIIADEAKLGLGDEAYLAGLIHDIGVMVEMQYDRNALIDVLDKVDPNGTGAPESDYLDAEVEIFGADHQDFGLGLCKKWKFPESFGFAAGFHHTPDKAPDEYKKLVYLIAVADRISARVDGSFRLDLPNFEITADLLEPIGMTPDQIENLIPKIEEAAANLDASIS